MPDYNRGTHHERSIETARPLNLTGDSVQFWNPLDNVTGDVSAVHGTEVYTNVTVNGTPEKQLPSGGEWSAGEFSTLMLAILPPERAAVFTHQRSESIRTRPAYRYDFAVDQAHSTWHLTAGHLPGAPALESYTTAYAGQIWIDKESGWRDQ